MNLIAKIHLLSDYRQMDSAYWGMGTSKNGLVYFALCTHTPGKSATFFSFNYNKNEIKPIFTLDKYIKVPKLSLSQGKVHTPIFEGRDKSLYFGTHFAYPNGEPQDVTYEGGHIISYNPQKNKITDLGIALPNEGILSLILDSKRMILYMLTAPSFNFVVYDINQSKFYDCGRITKKGSICRSLTLDNDGNVYGSFEKNKIFKFDRKLFKIKYLKTKLPTSNENIKEWSDKTRNGVNNIGRNIWRTALWNNNLQKIFGIHGGTSKLFEYDPNKEAVHELSFIGANIDENNPEVIYPTLSLSNIKIHYFTYLPQDFLIMLDLVK